MAQHQEGNFKGKVSLVTGASRGIGAGIAYELASRGSDVMLNGTNATKLSETAERIRKFGVKTETYAVDVSVKAEVQAMVEDVIKKYEKIDILVNNAGILKVTDFFEVNEEDWERIFAVNLKGAFLVTQAVARHMVKRRYGKIIMISCASVKAGGATANLAYYASKAGMIVMGRSLAKYLGKYNINVNNVAASFVETDMFKELTHDNPDRLKYISGLRVMQRPSTPSEVANAVAFLADDRASYITGETLSIDGGLSMD
jgi:3-oxoacyl-[acyl-carrier protein] reductase